MSATDLKRSLGLGHATAINMIDMVGIGPFITLPMVIDLWALHSGGVSIRAGRKGHYVSQIAASRASALRRKWIRRNSYGKEDYRFGEVADCSGQGHSGPSGGSGAGPSADQHHGVLQAVQCQDQRPGIRRPDHPGGGVGVQRSHLYLHHQNASGFHSVEAGRGRGQGFWYAEQGQGRQGEREAGPGNCQAEDARSERGFGRSGSQEREGYGALHGYRSYSLRLSHNVGVLAAQTASRRYHGLPAARDGGGRQGEQ